MSPLSGCFFWSSEWGASEASQRRNAARAAPQALVATSRPTARQARTLRLRAYATEAYRAERIGWVEKLQELLVVANRLLEPELGVRFALVDTRPWQLERSRSDRLEESLEALEALDPAEDVDVVLGLLGSVPRLTSAFEQLGMARLFGSHFVLRAANDAVLLEQIEQAFDELDARERRELHRARREHKEVVLLVHELGHLFGVPHVADATAIMYPGYSPEMESLTALASDYARLVLRHRPEAGEPYDEAAMLEALRTYLSDHADGWYRDEGADLLARIDSALEGAASTGSATSSSVDDRVRAAPLPEGPMYDVSSFDEATLEAFHDVRDLAAGRRYAEAWEQLVPLIDRFPDVYVVHELACSIAMTAELEGVVYQHHCQRMSDLAMRPAE
ncbi:MAG: matrixin family metalloprotease [Myxococcota bacterium]